MASRACGLALIARGCASPDGMDLGLQRKNVLVTGGGRGVGRAIGLAFAAEGANVVFHHNASIDGATTAVDEAVALGVSAVALQADIRDQAQVETLVANGEEALGPIDVLVNNAAFTKPGPFLDMDPADWAPQVDVTVLGMMRVTQSVLRSMVPRGEGGTVVNLMGDSGRVGESRLAAVATTRAAALGFTKSIAKEFARNNVRANCVGLGLVQTESLEEHSSGADDERMARILSMYPLRRLGRPDDVSPMVLLLASPLTGWMTGQVVSLNGGYAMP